MKKMVSLILAVALTGGISVVSAANDTNDYLLPDEILECSGDNDYTSEEMAAVEESAAEEVDLGSISDGYSLSENSLPETEENQMLAYTANNIPEYLFDAYYYAEKYDDLSRAFGRNKSQLYNHWLNYGKREGRSPSPVYDPNYYLSHNADLKNAFGSNYTALYNHFVTYGINEFRESSPIYSGGYYKSHYSDLQNAFGNNSRSYLNHFMNYGMREGRQASNDFNVIDYKNRYSDLRDAFGNTLKSYYYHYMEYGVDEGRNGKPSGSNSPAAVPDTTSNSTSNNTSQNSRTAWAKTSGSNLNMRSAATTNSSIVCKIPNRAQVTVYGNPTNGFYKVSYNGRTGYASARYISFSVPGGGTSQGLGGRLVDNVNRVNLIKQGSKTCKATAVAQSLNIIVGANRYTTSGMGGSNCRSINGQTYCGTNGNTYVATYKTDSYKGSASEQMSKINAAISAGLPIIVAVHKNGSGTKHHWVTIIGKSGSTYTIIDPATGTRRTMSSAGYAFGLADYSNGYHYGYVSFARR